MTDSAPQKNEHGHQISLIALRPENWQEFRQIRVHAVKSEPDFINGDWQQIADYPEEHWTGILSDKDNLVLGLLNGSKMIGMVAVFRHDGQEPQGWIGRHYILPKYRNFGYGRLLIKACLHWAKNIRKYKTVFISTRRTNKIAQKTYKSFGFTHDHDFETEFADGKDIEHCYRLELSQ